MDLTVVRTAAAAPEHAAIHALIRHRQAVLQPVQAAVINLIVQADKPVQQQRFAEIHVIITVNHLPQNPLPPAAPIPVQAKDTKPHSRVGKPVQQQRFAEKPAIIIARHRPQPARFKAAQDILCRLVRATETAQAVRP